ncbi:MAG: hypothetical protein QOI38_1842 [Sphingomonadales bacterium]|jgi:hypothetical protein|nr:hypothetical protein [Sphingomonadales bacterium]
MAGDGGAFAVVVGDDIIPASGEALPADALSWHPLLQRVVRIGEPAGSRVWIYYKGSAYLADPASLRPVGSIVIGAGDEVSYKGQPAVVRDVVWHFKDECANYYVTQNGRRVSKRLYDRDLELLASAP